MKSIKKYRKVYKPFLALLGMEKNKPNIKREQGANNPQPPTMQGDTGQNDLIICDVLNTRIRKAFKQRYPTAEELINSLDNNEVTKADLLRERRERLKGGNFDNGRTNQTTL